MKLAHLILAHKDPILLERLVKRLQHSDADIFIQLDKNSDIRDFIHIENIGGTRFITERVVSGWCNFGVVEATLNGFKQILELKNDYSHINLISGQDYPIKPIESIQQFFFDNPGKSFMRSFSIDDDEWNDGRIRLTRYNFGDFTIPGKYTLQRIANKLLPPRKVPDGIKPHGGSQWMAITPECAGYVLEYLKTNHKLKRYFKMVWAVDEVFFQTILANSHLKNRIVNYNLRHIEQDSGMRPINFTMAHKDVLTESKEFFARKFDRTVDTEILDHLDNIVEPVVK